MNILSSYEYVNLSTIDLGWLVLQEFYMSLKNSLKSNDKFIGDGADNNGLEMVKDEDIWLILLWRRNKTNKNKKWFKINIFIKRDI